MRRATSSPRTTRPKAAKPCPSGFRMPPKSSAGCGPRQMKKLDVAVFQAGHRRRLELDGWEALAAFLAARSRLDDRDSDRVVRLVVRAHDPVERAVREEAAIDVPKEILPGDRSADRVDLHLDLAALGAEDDVRQRLRAERGRDRHRDGESGGQPGTHAITY